MKRYTKNLLRLLRRSQPRDRSACRGLSTSVLEVAPLKAPVANSSDDASPHRQTPEGHQRGGGKIDAGRNDDVNLHFSRGWRIGVQNQLNLFCDQRVTLIRRG